MNQRLDKALLIHHTIRNVWAWTGGHADGERDLLYVAVKEASEETGISAVYPLSDQIASLDLLPVFGRIRKGRYVNAHLHLSVSYILICDETEEVRPQPAENSAAVWFPTEYFSKDHFDPFDVYLYGKWMKKALLFR